MKRTLATLWLIFFSLAVLVAASYSTEIETHVLSRTLHFGFDTFGRSCILLSLDAAFQSMVTILPIAIICLGLAFLGSLVKMFDGSKIQFFWNSSIDTLSTLPGFLIALSIGAFLENRFYTVLLASVLLVLPYLIRFFESQIIHLQSQEYIASAQALGGTRLHIFRRHFLPDLSHSVTAIFPFLMTRLLITETSLSFLGVNGSQNRETWGKLLYQGKDYLLEAPWICVLGGLPLFLTLLSFHLLSKPDQN